MAYKMKRLLPGLLLLFFLLPGVLFAQVPSITRLADNVPSDISVGRGWNRALSFAPLVLDRSYTWGGFGATGDLSDELWEHIVATDTWNRTGLTLLPRDMRYGDKTGGGFDRFVIAVGDTGSGTPIIDAYNTLLNTWATDSTLGGGWTWGFTGTAASNGRYYLMQGAATRRMWSIDITNLAGGWTVETPPPVTMGIAQFGVILQDPLLPDRLVAFERDNGNLHYYSILGDTWTFVGDIYTPGNFPTVAFAVDGFGTVAGTWDTVDTINLFVLNWTTSMFDSIGSWTDVNFTLGSYPATSVTLGASGQTEIIFGAGFTSLAAPPAGAEKFWGGGFFPPTAPITVTSAISGWVAFLGGGLAILFVAIVCGLFLWLVKAPPLMMMVCGWLSLILLFVLEVVSPAIVLIALVAFAGAIFFKVVMGSNGENI